jgi:hypothetical protein
MLPHYNCCYNISHSVYDHTASRQSSNEYHALPVM